MTNPSPRDQALVDQIRARLAEMSNLVEKHQPDCKYTGHRVCPGGKAIAMLAGLSRNDLIELVLVSLLNQRTNHPTIGTETPT